MNFSRHLVIVIILIAFFLLVIGFWATSVATIESNGAQSIGATFGIPKDSYEVVPSSNADARNARTTFISEIRALLRSQPEVVVEEEVVPYIPPPVMETVPVVIPVLVPEEPMVLEPSALPIATTTNEVEAPLSIQ